MDKFRRGSDDPESAEETAESAELDAKSTSASSNINGKSDVFVRLQRHAAGVVRPFPVTDVTIENSILEEGCDVTSSYAAQERAAMTCGGRSKHSGSEEITINQLRALR